MSVAKTLRRREEGPPTCYLIFASFEPCPRLPFARFLVTLQTGWSSRISVLALNLQPCNGRGCAPDGHFAHTLLGGC